MNQGLFKILLVSVAALFTVYFSLTIIPELIKNPDIIGAFAAGFVNPYSSGYSTDVILCWVILAIWIVHERLLYGVQYGWVCLVLGLVPGVAVGFALYLLIRQRYVKPDSISHAS